MKKCLRKKCLQDFEPNKPKQVFCSAKCRVYFSREEKQVPVTNHVELPNDYTQTNEVAILDVDGAIKPLTPKGKKKMKKILSDLKQEAKTLDRRFGTDIEPAEGTNRFFLKYGAFTHGDAKKLKP